jgi:hypothetical protein
MPGRTKRKPRSPFIQPPERLFRRIELPPRLTDGPAASGAVNGDDGPTGAVLVTQMNEDRVPVVLHTGAVARISLLVESPRTNVVGIGDERCPPRPGRSRQPIGLA